MRIIPHNVIRLSTHWPLPKFLAGYEGSFIITSSETVYTDDLGYPKLIDLEVQIVDGRVFATSTPINLNNYWRHKPAITKHVNELLKQVRRKLRNIAVQAEELAMSAPFDI